jgi:hypothetical protein
MRHFAIWAVWLTGAGTLLFAGFYTAIQIFTSMGVLDSVDLGPIYRFSSVLSQMTHAAFTLSLLVYLQSVHNDLFKAERAVEHARYSIAPVTETIAPKQPPT